MRNNKIIIVSYPHICIISSFKKIFNAEQAYNYKHTGAKNIAFCTHCYTILVAELPPFNVQKAENGPKKAENGRNSTAKKQKKRRGCFLMPNHLLSIVLAR